MNWLIGLRDWVDARLPIVPLTVEGSRFVMTKGELTTRPGRVRLTVHTPIETTTVRARDARALAERVRETVVAGLSSPAASASP